jgi:hypothetical protein
MKIRVIRDAQGQVVATVNQASEELGILVEPELGLDTQTEELDISPSELFDLDAFYNRHSRGSGRR